MRLRYDGYLSDAAFVRSALAGGGEAGAAGDPGRLLAAGRRAARSLTRLDAEEALWEHLERAGEEEAPWFDDVEGVALPASAALLDTLGWTPPPPSEELVRQAHEAVRPLRGLRLSGEVRRVRVRELRDRIAGLVLDLEEKLAAGPETGDAPDAPVSGDVLVPVRARTAADIAKQLARKLERGVNVLAAVITIGGVSVGGPGDGNPTERPAPWEEVDPRTLRQLWMDVLDGTDLLAQLEDDTTEGLERLRDAGVDDPDVALWLAVLDGDDQGVHQALEEGADPDRPLRSVLDQHLGRGW